MGWGLSGLVCGDLTNDDWIVNSGASAHLIKDSSMLYNWHVCDDPHGVILSDKSQLMVTRKVKERIRVKVDGEVFWIELRDVCFAPNWPST